MKGYLSKKVHLKIKKTHIQEVYILLIILLINVICFKSAKSIYKQKMILYLLTPYVIYSVTN